ncbi:MAG: GatB/YqeY domain-containing protein [Deferribacteres bacterium]|nr:GatB/YqeY domain-containing protein [Deferribacteres bacterium]
MGVKEKIMADMKEAMKAKDMAKVSTLRLLLSEIKNKEIDKKGELSDEEIYALIQKAVKQRKESIEQYKSAGREDLVQKEEAELKILEAYLPEQLSEEELEKIIDEAIKEAEAATMKDMGKVMRLVMPRVKGRADGKVVNEMVKRKLGG